MKASYTKPLFDVEIFSTNQSVIKNCAMTVQFNHTGTETCGWDLGGGSVVFINTEKCTINGADIEVYCYNNPTDRSQIIQS